MFEVKLDIHIEWGHCDPAIPLFVWMESGMDRLFSVAYRPIAEMVHGDTNYRGVPLLNTQASFQKPAPIPESCIAALSVNKQVHIKLIS